MVEKKQYMAKNKTSSYVLTGLSLLVLAAKCGNMLHCIMFGMKTYPLMKVHENVRVCLEIMMKPVY